MKSEIYHVEIKLFERADSKPNARLFDGSLSACNNIFGAISIKVAMNSHDAIAWINEIENRAFTWNNTPKFDYETGEPSGAKIVTHRMTVK